MQAGLVQSNNTHVIGAHLGRLAALDATGYKSAKREIGNYLVDDARDNIRSQKLFDGSPMQPAKSAGAQSYHTTAKSGKNAGKLRRVNKPGRLTMQDSGRLRDSFTFVDTASGLLVGSAVEYAAIQHFGGVTKAHLIVAKHAKALRTPFGLFKSVHHPGSKIPARPVLGVGMRQALQIGYIVNKYLEGTQ